MGSHRASAGLARSGDDDGFIDKAEFEKALGLKASLFCDRIFMIFDKNSDANIAFDEFVSGLSVFSNRAPQEEKIDVSFQIYDIDEDGYISREDLRKMLQATVTENDLELSVEQVESLVASSFEQAGVAEDKNMDKETYAQLVKQRPAMLRNMTIPSLSVSR